VPGEDDEARSPGAENETSSYDLGRLLAFSDGVFAIAITLLVLNIPVPRVGHGPGESLALAGAIQGLLPNLFGFALSFLLVGTQWIAHHKLLRRLSFTNMTILWLNLLVLMGICLVPFATSVLVDYGDVPAGAIAYATLQSAIGIAFVAFRLYLLAHDAIPRRSLVLSWVPLFAFLVSIPAAFLGPRLAFAIWVLGFVGSRAQESGVHRRVLGRARRLAGRQ
jgi:uncharacterized membrane protein